MADWQYTRRIEWSATDGRKGGAERNLAGDGKIQLSCRRKRSERKHWFLTWRRLSSVSVSQWYGLGRRMSIFRRKIFAGAVRVFRASVACSV